MKDLNVRPESLKLLEEYIEKTLEHIDIDRLLRLYIDLLKRATIAQEIRARIVK
jgi:hypothetical protein